MEEAVNEFLAAATAVWALIDQTGGVYETDTAKGQALHKEFERRHARERAAWTKARDILRTLFPDEFAAFAGIW